MRKSLRSSTFGSQGATVPDLDTPACEDKGMRCVIAGGREHRDPRILEAALAACPFTDSIEEVIEGGAAGIDALAAEWAKKRGLRHTRVVADWKKHGKAAGPMRNRIMAEIGDALLAIPGEGPGTISMIREAAKAGLTVFVYDVKAVGA